MFTKEESVIKSILLIHKEIFTARYYIPSWFYKNQLGFFMPKFPYIAIPHKGGKRKIASTCSKSSDVR